MISAAEVKKMRTDETVRERLRANLPTFRMITGWTQERLGELLGVTRMTIANLENARIKMSTVMYLAIRKLFDEEIENDNDVLKWALLYFVDEDTSQYKHTAEIKDRINKISNDIGKRRGKKAVGDEIKCNTELKLLFFASAY